MIAREVETGLRRRTESEPLAGRWWVPLVGADWLVQFVIDQPIDLIWHAFRVIENEFAVSKLGNSIQIRLPAAKKNERIDPKDGNLHPSAGNHFTLPAGGTSEPRIVGLQNLTFCARWVAADRRVGLPKNLLNPSVSGHQPGGRSGLRSLVGNERSAS